MMTELIHQRIAAITADQLAGDPDDSCDSRRSNLYRDTLKHIRKTSTDPITRIEAEAALEAEKSTWEAS